VRAVKVLIVDDQPTYREVAREVVQSTPGFEVIGEASTGEESLELSRDLLPDLVLMDVNLPGIDGMEATRQITQSARPPVVFLISTYESDDYSTRAEECGAAGFIPKSAFDPDLLASSWSDANA
jgi:DNA-binding NarL/FixJ family response regulator